MTWRRDRLPELVRAMAGRPRHEALRGHLTELLRSGFGAAYEDIAHEVYLLDNSGRIDTLWGATVIELKRDLKRELDAVLARMPAYLTDAVARPSARKAPAPRPASPRQDGRKPKLTPHQQREAIKRRDVDGERIRNISRSYNVHNSTISRLQVCH